MKVFFTCSTRSISKHGRVYRTIRDEIIHQGHKINRDWIDYSINAATRSTPDTPKHKFYQDVMAAILTADAVVVDATIKSMSVGHQLTYALQKDKPVLLLRQKKDGAPKEEKLFVEGSDAKDLVVTDYQNVKDIPKILREFFSKFEMKSRKRFNLVLTESQDNYISWVAFQYKKTKTDVIQEAIDKLAKRDQSYKNYLVRQS